MCWQSVTGINKTTNCLTLYYSVRSVCRLLGAIISGTTGKPTRTHGPRPGSGREAAEALRRARRVRGVTRAAFGRRGQTRLRAPELPHHAARRAAPPAGPCPPPACAPTAARGHRGGGFVDLAHTWSCGDVAPPGRAAKSHTALRLHFTAVARHTPVTRFCSGPPTLKRYSPDIHSDTP